jgi:GNAT superfamily N-acetyltransferase
MPFASWWRGDPLPALPPLDGLSVRRVTSWAETQRVTGLSETRVVARYQDGHSLYAAYLDEHPAGYGWLARRAGRIDELRLQFALPRGEVPQVRLATRPEYRGRGIYPLLLQAIIAQEDGIERFWIGYEGHNLASERGILKAGFQIVGDLVIEGWTAVAVTLTATGRRGQAFAQLAGLPALEAG